jgi:hypothetical protein
VGTAWPAARGRKEEARRNLDALFARAFSLIVLLSSILAPDEGFMGYTEAVRATARRVTVMPVVPVSLLSASVEFVNAVSSVVFAVTIPLSLVGGRCSISTLGTVGPDRQQPAPLPIVWSRRQDGKERRGYGRASR